MRRDREREEGRPPLLLFRMGDVPFVRSSVLPYYALPERYLSLACWFLQSGSDPTGLFEVLPEAPVDKQHHPGFWALLADLNNVMMNDEALLARLSRATDAVDSRVGYHTSATYEDVRDFLQERYEVIEFHREVALRQALRDDDDHVNALVDKHLRLRGAIAASRERLHDFLVGGGALPDPSVTVPKRLVEVLRGRVPSRFTATDERLLDVLVTRPSLLLAAEKVITIDDGVLDQHALWREKLLARGVSEATLERNLLTTRWLTTRDGAMVLRAEDDAANGWLLGRIAADLPAFLHRHRGLADFEALMIHLLVETTEVWSFPPFRPLATKLLTHHLDDLTSGAILSLDPGDDPAMRKLLRKQRKAILKAFPDIATDDYDALFLV